MKKLSTRILAVAAALAVLAVLAPVPAAHAADGVPVSITMTLPGGSSNVGTNAPAQGGGVHVCRRPRYERHRDGDVRARRGRADV